MYKCKTWKRMNCMAKGNQGWVTSRDMEDGCCCIIYEIIGNEKSGYVARACNNAFGFERVAVSHKGQTTPSHYKNVKALMQRIENGSQLWLCTGYCNCVGEYTKTTES